VPKTVWSQRYQHINDFEKTLFESNVTILKFFLHISKEEQKKRLMKRLKNPKKHWKMNPQDIEERKLWDEYMRAYEDAIGKCNAPHAPWFVIPANKKWFRNLAISEIIIHALEALHMEFPKPKYDLSKIVIE
jgi:polyphosphate kinase 2 (PPK2 family)